MGQNPGPRMGLATGITHETKPTGEIIQNGLVSGPSGTLKAGSSFQAVPQGTKAVRQPQAAEITEIAPKMPIGPNAVTHMAEAKRAEAQLAGGPQGACGAVYRAHKIQKPET